MWNVFFADAVGTHGFTNAKFADDLTLLKLFLHNTPPHFVMNELEACQHRLHLWGQTNCAVFDASKEHFRIIATTQSEEKTFKLLGTLFETQLTMREEVGRVRSKAIKALLRTRRFYATFYVTCVIIGRNRQCYCPRSDIAFGHS